MKAALRIPLVGLVLAAGVCLASDADVPMWFRYPPR